jgi:hypothetical protein
MARTRTLGIECVTNNRGCFINVSIVQGPGSVPALCLGPYPEEIPYIQALSLVATELRMDNRGIDLAYK